MEPTAFKMRRVSIGVVVGLLVVSLAFSCWVQYRRSQYQKHEQDVLGRYQRGYTLCTASGTAPFVCRERILQACVADPFWQVGKPFSFDAQVATPDAIGQCRDRALIATS
jgi:hypothetical protein